jgi:hypothetical protein
MVKLDIAVAYQDTVAHAVKDLHHTFTLQGRRAVLKYKIAWTWTLEK